MNKNTLTIPDGKTIIKAEEYAGQLFSQVEFPSSLLQIEERAFADCPELTSVWLPEQLEEIGREAFAGCVKLRKVFIPKSVVEIGENAFDYENCEIFCEAAVAPKGWYHYIFEGFGTGMDEPSIETFQDSWCFYDINWEYPEWYI